MAEKRIIAIGGGELKSRETLGIEEYIAGEAKKAAGVQRACGLFIPTASHDCMPYYNTFHKVYTGLFDIKTDVALTVGREINIDKMRDKFDKADFIYVGGGNTVFMLEQWRKSGITPLIREAYERGKIICGLSAGAICWFEKMYSDSVVEDEYSLYDGLGWIKGVVSPHYDDRKEFDEIVVKNRYRAYGIENYAALEIIDGEPNRSISCGGSVYYLDGSGGNLFRKKI